MNQKDERMIKIVRYKAHNGVITHLNGKKVQSMYPVMEAMELHKRGKIKLIPEERRSL